MYAQDVMTTNVISISEQTPVHEIIDAMLRHRISAVPVVDSSNHVVGIVSEGDLLPSADGRAWTKRSWWLSAMLGKESVDYEKAHGRTAGEIMTRDVVTVAIDTPLVQIAELLERHHIKRTPVLHNGRLAGIVSRANLLHGLASDIINRHEPSAAADRALRNQLLETLLETPGLTAVLVNVTVNDGAVTLWGLVENAQERLAAESAIQQVPGVKSVLNHLGLEPMSGVPV